MRRTLFEVIYCDIYCHFSSIGIICLIALLRNSKIIHHRVSMIIQLQHIHNTIFTITVTIVLIHQMIAHHFPIQADVMGAVAVTKSPFI